MLVVRKGRPCPGVVAATRRNAEIAVRADEEHRLWMQGDERGFCGQVPAAFQHLETAVDRQLQALHMLGVLRCDEDLGAQWRDSLHEHIQPSALAVPDLSVAENT